MKKLTKNEFYMILAGAFTAAIIMSNILAFKLFNFFGIFVIDAGLLTFPIVYIVNDVLSEIYGFKKAKKVILLGFAMNLIAVIAYNVAIKLPYPEYWTGQEVFQTMLASSARILIASFIAYLCGSLLNSYIMVKMRERGGKSLFARAMTSTIFGEFVDSLVFSSIAFMFNLPMIDLVFMIVGNTILKSSYEFIAFPFTKVIVGKAKQLKD